MNRITSYNVCYTKLLRTHIQLGRLMIYVDSVIVLFGLFAFGDWAIPLYSWVVIYITGKVIDITLEGADYNKALLIISKEHVV